jgi:hypothetical protein
VIGFLFSIAGVRNLSKTNLERMYIIPTATWLLFAFCLLLVGWFISSAPPTSLRLLNAPSKLPPCCWRAWECELQREDLDFFDCDGGSEGSVRGVGGSSGGGFYLFEGGSRLVAAAGATARVKDQSCGALLQYVGLQIAGGTYDDLQDEPRAGLRSPCGIAMYGGARAVGPRRSESSFSAQCPRFLGYIVGTFNTQSPLGREVSSRAVVAMTAPCVVFRPLSPAQHYLY